MTEIRWQLAEQVPQGTLFDGHDEVLERRPGVGQFAGMEFLHVRARRIVNDVPHAARLPFRFTINAYRGCSHACRYCFARPTHTYLGLNGGEDFERRIVVKVNAVERVRAELASPKWTGESIAMGTNTDPYQRCDGKYRLTRGIIEELVRAENPFSILTKSPRILRDLDLLVEARRRGEVHTAFSIGTLDEDVWRATEPGAPHPRRRVEAIARLKEAGIPCSVLVAPVIPGVSDDPDQLDEVVRACLEAGADSVSPILLHLRPGVREEFLPWLQGARPDLVASYEERYRRPYAPKAEQEALSRLVAGLVEKYRPGPPRPIAPRGTRRPTTPATSRERRPTPPTAAPVVAQLSFGL